MKGSQLAAGAAALAMLLGGCASTPTPYQPVSSANAVRGGYSETRLGPESYRVTFTGNTLTSRERVEASLLYRAAELTLQQGNDWFVIVDRQTEHRVEQESPYHPWFYGDYAYWRPYWRYYGPGTGWQTWYPYYGDPFWASRVDGRTVEQFEVSAEIRMGQGAMPAADAKAFDARDVIARLGPEVRQAR